MQLSKITVYETVFFNMVLSFWLELPLKLFILRISLRHKKTSNSIFDFFCMAKVFLEYRKSSILGCLEYCVKLLTLQKGGSSAAIQT